MGKISVLTVLDFLFGFSFYYIFLVRQRRQKLTPVAKNGQFRYARGKCARKAWKGC